MIELEHAARVPQTVPRIEYARLAPSALATALPSDVLAAVAFGRTERYELSSDPRLIRVPLEPLGSNGIVELWRAAGCVRTGSEGPVRFAADETHLLGVIELDERSHGGLAATAEWAYAAIRRFQSRCGYPHLLRMWNYFDAINLGEGDDERYKQFCIGRAAQFGPAARAQRGRFPAATAIGSRNGPPSLLIYWLAARSAGTPLENPRQVSAYNYPRRYGPAAPNFSRAMLAHRLLMISGTASVIGHASRHVGSLYDQLDETLENLDSVLERAAAMQPAIPRHWGEHTLLKLYLRDGGAADCAAAHLAARLPSDVQWLMLEADICRAELLVEIECTHGG